MNYFTVIGYAYDADLHCLDCAGDVQEGDEDAEGNEKHPIFAGEEYEESGLFCGDCSAEIQPPWEAPAKVYRGIRRSNAKGGPMVDAPFTRNVSSKYGAPMGRHSDPAERFQGAKVHLRRIRLVDGCYDPGGAYWGMGAPLWCAWDDADGFEIYFRAADREAAKAKLPGARFFR